MQDMSTRLQHSPGKAVLCMSSGTAFIAGTDILMKHLAADHSLPAILWVRNLMILLAMYALLRHSGEGSRPCRASDSPPSGAGPTRLDVRGPGGLA